MLCTECFDYMCGYVRYYCEQEVLIIWAGTYDSEVSPMYCLNAQGIVSSSQELFFNEECVAVKKPAILPP